MSAAPTAAPGHACTFADFFEFLFVPMQRLELPVKPEHREVCDELEKAVLGEYAETQTRIIIVNIPFRTGKTKISQALAAYMWAYFDDAQMIYTGYAGPLAELSANYIAQTMRAPWYIDLYGDKIHTSAGDHVTTTNGGNLFAEGVCGELTGKGAGLKRLAGGFIMIDDPAKPADALSPVMSQKNRDWFDLTLRSRRNSEIYTPIILMGHRLGPDDLPGHLVKTYPEECLVIRKPGIVDGVSRFPETFTAAGCEILKRTRIGRYTYASQIQQEPVVLGGNLVPTEKFGRFDLREARALLWDRLIITVDTAMKAKEANDNSAASLFGLLDRRAYWLDLVFGKWESPELFANLKMFWNKTLADYPHAAAQMVIEEKASGSSVLQLLNADGIPAMGIERDIDKVRRVQAILPFVENGFVLVPMDDKQAPWLAAAMEEVGSFNALMTHAHDDITDTLADGVSGLLGEAPSAFDIVRTSQRSFSR